MDKTKTPPRSVGEIEGFIDLLLAACDDAKTRAALERLLSMPDAERRDYVQGWVNELIVQEAPADFRAAIACLTDDAIAEQAYVAIQQCRRPG
ncbi:MAG: hypothetical protein ACREUW_15795 [Burkholderiales bacterium]